MKKTKEIMFKDVIFLGHMREPLGGYFLEPIRCDNDTLFIPNYIDGIVVKGIFRGDVDTYSAIVLEDNNTDLKL